MDLITLTRLELGLIDCPCEACRWCPESRGGICEHPAYLDDNDRPCSPPDNWQDFEEK